MEEEFSVTSAVGRDIGKKRQRNEDFVAFFEPGDLDELSKNGRLYIVADGVGGAVKGEIASKYAAEKVLYDFFNDSDLDLGKKLAKAIRSAGNEIYEHMQRKGSGAKMATTMVAAVIRDGLLTVANVGDSRAYLIRNGEAKQISRDHTIAGELLRDGEITEPEAMNLRGKNKITRSLGGEPNVHVDIFPEIPLMLGDRIVLCSDGMTRYAMREDIAYLSAEGDPDRIVQKFIDYANDKGGADNISLAFIEIGDQQIHPAEIIRRGNLPVQVSWDEMETQPVGHPIRQGGPSLKLRELLAPRQWIVLGVSGTALIMIVSLLALTLIQGPASQSEIEATSAQGIDKLPSPSIGSTQVGFAPDPTAVPEESASPQATEPVLESGEFLLEYGEFRVELSTDDVDFSDGFDTGEGWEFHKNKILLEPSQLEAIDAKKGDQFIGWSFRKFPWPDFYVEVEAQIGKCDGSDAYGIAVRVDDKSDKAYAAEFSCDGNYRVRMFNSDPNGNVVLSDWKWSEMIKTGSNALNRVGILAKEDKIYVVVDRQIIGQVIDDRLTSGGISLYANAFNSEPLIVHFDNLSVWVIE